MKKLNRKGKKKTFGKDRPFGGTKRKNLYNCRKIIFRFSTKKQNKEKINKTTKKQKKHLFVCWQTAPNFW